MADTTILTRLDGLKLKYEEIGQKLTDPEVIADVKQFVQLNKEYKELEPIIETSDRFRTAIANLSEAKDVMANDKDEEMREMAREEIAELEPAIERMEEEEIKLLLIPKDPQDSKNAIVEIRGGTGGDEAAIFAGDLLRMYTKYVESKGWRYEITSFSDVAAGGYKEVVLKVTGRTSTDAQIRIGRAPRTARAADRDPRPRPHLGRVGGRAARSRGIRRRNLDERHPQGHLLRLGTGRAVGQHDLFGHPPDPHPDGGIVVQCQDQKSQLKNFDKAFEELRTRVFNLEYSKYLDEIASKRKTMVSTGDRSAKIRTYNYPQGRITDHRINYTIYNLAAFMDGDIQDCIDHLIVAENAERLKESEL